MEEISLTRGQVALDGSSHLPAPWVCQGLAWLWWGRLVMSRSLKSALAVTTKVCHFGSDDKFYKCHEAGRVLLSITDENQAYLDPHASAAGIPPFKRTEHLSPAYSGLSRHQTLTFCKRHQVAVNIA